MKDLDVAKEVLFQVQAAAWEWPNAGAVTLTVSSPAVLAMQEALLRYVAFLKGQSEVQA